MHIILILLNLMLFFLNRLYYNQIIFLCKLNVIKLNFFFFIHIFSVSLKNYILLIKKTNLCFIHILHFFNFIFFLNQFFDFFVYFLNFLFCLMYIFIFVNNLTIIFFIYMLYFLNLILKWNSLFFNSLLVYL